MCTVLYFVISNNFTAKRNHAPLKIYCGRYNSWYLKATQNYSYKTYWLVTVWASCLPLISRLVWYIRCTWHCIIILVDLTDEAISVKWQLLPFQIFGSYGLIVICLTLGYIFWSNLYLFSRWNFLYIQAWWTGSLVKDFMTVLFEAKFFLIKLSPSAEFFLLTLYSLIQYKVRILDLGMFLFTISNLTLLVIEETIAM